MAKREIIVISRIPRRFGWVLRGFFSTVERRKKKEEWVGNWAGMMDDWPCRLEMNHEWE